MEQKHCWVITEGRLGNKNPAMGLAEAVARLDPHVIRQIRLKSSLIPKALSSIAPDQTGAHLATLAELTAPWPSLVIGCGKLSASVTAWVRNQSQKCQSLGNEQPSFAVQLLKPPGSLARYDLVIAPAHDNLNGPNVISSIGSLSRVTDEALAEAHSNASPYLPRVGQKTLAVLIGGATKRQAMPDESIAHLFDLLEQVTNREYIQLLISLSPRSGERVKALVQKRLEGLPAHLWDGTGTNPYMAYLAFADAILVTSDSINMISDAASTGKPVYIHSIPGMKSKVDWFIQSLTDRGITRDFAGKMESWAYQPLAETQAAVEQVIARQKKCRATRTRQV